MIYRWEGGGGGGRQMCVFTFNPSNLHCSKCSASCSRVPSNMQLTEGHTHNITCLPYSSHMMVT